MRVILIVFLFSSITSYSMWDTLYIDSSTYIYRGGWQVFIIKNKGFEISCNVPKHLKKEDLGGFLKQRKDFTTKSGIIKKLNNRQYQLEFDTLRLKHPQIDLYSEFSCNINDTLLPVRIHYEFNIYGDSVVGELIVKFNIEIDSKYKNDVVSISNSSWESMQKKGGRGSRDVFTYEELILKYDLNAQKIKFIGVISKPEEIFLD